MTPYDHKKIEPKWQKEWEKKKAFAAPDSSKKKKWYSLIEFPYPSGDGLHVGHIRSNTAMDIISRKRRREGFNVLYPIGWDAFGLPTENYAIKTGIQPAVVTKKNTDIFRRQLKSLGFSFDWSREINTTDPKYYKWTQWIFLQFLKTGLAYKKKMAINWCPKDLIGLANEEVVDGKCERCGTPVEKREKEQWMLAITKYADRLDKDLDLVDYLPEIKTQQRNWIGRSEGALIRFELINPGTKSNFLLLHGYTGSAKTNFFSWLKIELEKRGYEVEAPELPHTDAPIEEEQVGFVLSKCKIDKNTIIVGHSLGGVVAIKALMKSKQAIRQLVLVAPAADPTRRGDDYKASYHNTFNWDYDFSLIKNLVPKISILSDLQEDFRVEYLEFLAEKLSAKLITTNAKEEHFCALEEPDILDAVLPSIEVFTTRPDTLFGVTYVVLAPEHPLVRELLPLIKNRSEALVYITKTKKESDIERTDATREKTGVELKGVKAVNPVNGEEVPVYIADYVLADYGTGAVMAVPAHDDRDFEFAKKYGLPVKRVILKPNAPIKSYLMGADQISDSDLEKVGVKVVEKKSDGDRTLILDPNKLSEYESLIKEKLSPGFWNEYIGNEAVFIFKDKQGKITRFVLDKNNEEEIDRLAAQYIGEGWNKQSPWSWMAQNDWYKDIIIYTDEGKLINSAQFNNKDSSSIKKEITVFAGGQWISKYKLRDWVFSRQRYWGEPIPVVHCERCALQDPSGQGIVPVPEKDLPVKLPPVKNYKPTETGESPLAAITKWVNVKCPKCKGKAKRETDTMPNWAGSSWYYLRYTDPNNSAKFADMKKLKYWTPVDWYNGGMEHVTLHLLYSRFWHKFLFDQGLVPTSESYTKRTAHGFVLGPGGEKMSKSRGNVINPDVIIEKVGADSLRLYEMFMGPFDQAIVWDENGIVGCRRFLERVWKFQDKVESRKSRVESQENQSVIPAKAGIQGQTSDSISNTLDSRLHGNDKTLSLIQKTIKKVSEDIENMRFNTAVSALMILLNEFEPSYAKASEGKENYITKENYEIFLQLLAPFAPHITEELWSMLGNKISIHEKPWPVFDPSLLIESSVKIAVQVNGKTRAEIEIAIDAGEEAIKATALALESVKKWLNGKAPARIIVVKGRLINIVCPVATVG